MADSRSESDSFKFPNGRTLVLTDNLRQPLKELLEPLTPEKELNSVLKRVSKIVAIGDMVTLTLAQHRITPDICVVDFKTKRGAIDVGLKRDICSAKQKVVNIKNLAGTITDSMWVAIKTAYNSKDIVRIEVDGEEDLASLVCLSIAPFGTVVIYGMPNMGIEIVHTNDRTRKFANEILGKMMVV